MASDLSCAPCEPRRTGTRPVGALRVRPTEPCNAAITPRALSLPPDSGVPEAKRHGTHDDAVAAGRTKLPARRARLPGGSTDSATPRVGPAVKTEGAATPDAGATGVWQSQTRGSDEPLHIDVERCGDRWRAVVVRGDGAPEVTTLHQLIRRLAELSAGPERPSGGLR